MLELTGDDLNIFSSFEKITKIMPSDYLVTENFMIFLVPPAQLGRAIGNKGANIEKLTQTFRKKVVVIADNPDPEGFVRSFFGNIEVEDIDVRNVMGEINMIVTVSEKDRGIAIGRNGERVKAAKTLLKKKFNATIALKTRREMF